MRICLISTAPAEQWQINHLYFSDCYMTVEGVTPIVVMFNHTHKWRLQWIKRLTSKGDLCFSMCLGLNAQRHTQGKARGRWEEGHDNSSSIRLCAKPFSFSSLWCQNYCYFMLKCGDEQMEMPRISSQDGRQVIGLASALRQHWFFFSQQQLVRFCVFSIITLQKRMMCYPPL